MTYEIQHSPKDQATLDEAGHLLLLFGDVENFRPVCSHGGIQDLVVFLTEGRVVAVVVYEIFTHKPSSPPKLPVKRLLVTAMQAESNRMPGLWRQAEEYMLTLAKEAECDSITIQGRRGWIHRLRGDYEVEQVWLTKKVVI